MMDENDRPAEGNELMNDLAAAWAQSENERHEEIQDPTPEPVPQPEPETEVPPLAAEDAPAEIPVPEGAEPTTEAPESIDVPEWAPAGIREHWEAMPEMVREEFLERERSHSASMQRHAEAAQFAGMIGQAIKPYEQVLRMEADNPAHALQIFGNITSTMRNGTPTEKAQMLALMSQRYSVDMRELDTALAQIYSGEANPATSQPSQPQQPQEFRDPRVDQMLQHQQAEASNSARSELSEFGKDHEFLEDVRHDMADLLDLATARNQPMSLQQAYDKAVAMNPSVQAVITNRNLSQKQEAASSISGAPGGTPVPGEPNNVREALERAWDGG